MDTIEGYYNIKDIIGLSIAYWHEGLAIKQGSLDF